MRSIPDSMDPDVVAAIDARLARVEAEHDVRLLRAIESGSRAWGFPSPDSDDDCRFLHARPVDHCLGLPASSGRLKTSPGPNIGASRRRSEWGVLPLGGRVDRR